MSDLRCPTERGLALLCLRRTIVDRNSHYAPLLCLCTADDGEIAALRLVSAHDGDPQLAQLAARTLAQGVDEETQRALTHMHETFYLRKYEINCCYQMSALYPSLQKGARICDYLCCRCRKGSESLFCSQVHTPASFVSPASLIRPFEAPCVLRAVALND